MIYIILSMIVIICTTYAIRKVLFSASKQFELPFPQRLENGIVIITLADLSSLWVELAEKRETSIEQSIQEPLTREDKLKATGNEWIQQQEFLTYLIKSINEHMNLVSSNRYDSFSFGETVYLSSGALWNYISSYGLSHNIKEAHNKSKRESIILEVITMLSNQGIANSAGIKFSVEYLITFKDGTILKKHFIPLNAKHFVVEQKKEGILSEIIKIEIKENEEK